MKSQIRFLVKVPRGLGSCSSSTTRRDEDNGSRRPHFDGRKLNSVLLRISCLAKGKLGVSRIRVLNSSRSTFIRCFFLCVIASRE